MTLATFRLSPKVSSIFLFDLFHRLNDFAREAQVALAALRRAGFNRRRRVCERGLRRVLRVGRRPGAHFK